MEIPKDVWEKITKEMRPEDLVKFCQSSLSKKLCNSNEFWIRRFKKDFRDMIPYVKDFSKSKEHYLRTFAIISESAENMRNMILNDLFKGFSKNLTEEYKSSLFPYFYDLIIGNFANLLRNIDYPAGSFSISKISILTNHFLEPQRFEKRKMFPPFLKLNDDIYFIISKEIKNSTRKLVDYWSIPIN